jgi:hypothetical protein
MRLALSMEERIVLNCLQEQECPLPATGIADITGLESHDVMDACVSLAEKELFIAVDRTAGELSPLGRNHNLFNDESIDELPGKIKPETETLLRYFLDDPGAKPSIRVLVAFDGLKPEQIENAIEELEAWGYPARSRIES